jgi:hypothetical protein
MLRCVNPSAFEQDVEDFQDGLSWCKESILRNRARSKLVPLKIVDQSAKLPFDRSIPADYSN